MLKSRHTLGLIIALSFYISAARADFSLAQEPVLRNAFIEAKNGTLTAASVQTLDGHLLLPWLQAISLKQQMPHATQEQVLSALAHNATDPSSVWLIGQWRNELLRRQDYLSLAQWNRLYADASNTNRCGVLMATAENQRDRQWQQNALALWRTELKPGSACTALFGALKLMAVIDTTQAWSQFDRLIANNSLTTLPDLIALLNGADNALASQYADFLAKPYLPNTHWPDDARTRLVISKGLQAAAMNDLDGVEHLLGVWDALYPLAAEQKAQVQSELALWSLVNYLPNAELRYFAVPNAYRSVNLREWYMRYRFTRGDEAKSLEAFSELLPIQRQEPRWQYFQARLLERSGHVDDARSLYVQASQSASFYGWLAADRIARDYNFCPLVPKLPRHEKRLLKQSIGLNRALALWQLGEVNYAIWEWNAAYKLMTAEQQRQAILWAQELAWYDRAVFSLENNELNQRYYELRFATPYLEAFEQAATQFQLDPSWLMAHARAESVFMPNVHSSANARGVLQLLPSTAQAIASKYNLAWLGEESLFDPLVNIPLGAGTLRSEFDSYPNKAYQAIAAYNAGPTAVTRWQTDRPDLDPDFWIETVPYKETRDYLARVLAFSVIYDWRLNRAIIPLSTRVVGNYAALPLSKKMHCFTPNTVLKKTL